MDIPRDHHIPGRARTAIRAVSDMSRAAPTGVSQAALLRLFSRRLALLIGTFGLSIAAAVLLAAVYHFHHTHAQALTATEENARNITRALADTVARTVQSVDITLASLAELLAERSLAPDDPVVTGALSQRLAFAPYLRQILVVAVNGRVLYSSAQPPPERIDLESLFGDHLQPSWPLIIGTNQPGRYVGTPDGAGQQFIPLGRWVRDRDGKPLGLVIATANPLHFEDIFDAIELGPAARLRLWRYDGRFLAGDAPDHRHAGDILTDHLRNTEFNTYVDGQGEASVVSYRTTLNWPLVIEVSIPLDTALAPWRRELITVGMPATLIALVVLILTALLVSSVLQHARHEEALRLSDRVLASISNGVTIVDATAPDNPLVYANPAFERITGYTIAEVLGQNLRFLHRRTPNQPGLAAIRQALTAGGEATAVLSNERADGELFWNELTVGAVRDLSGRITHYVGVQRDITRHKEADERLRRAYDDIARFNRDLERFAFVLAHHLQEPARLQAVFSEQLARLLPKPLPDEQAECLSHIRRGARHLRTLLHDVETYITLDRATVTGECSADAALDGALRLIAARIEAAAATIDRMPLGPVRMAQPRLTQLFRLVIENAVEYRDPDRPLRITIDAVDDDNGRVTLRITDTGIGIDADYLSRIFEVFERLHTHDQHDGTGMGLALAGRIAELAGGSIWATSTVGEGTTIHLLLPRLTG